MDKKLFTPLEYDKTANDKQTIKIFLAGTIDDGKSLDWQKALTDEICSIDTNNQIFIYNPRRDKWPDGNNKNDIDKQIRWELYHLEKSDIIIMNILPKSKSPISLMELGLFAKNGKLIVFCQESFYRYDNIRIVCERYGIPLFNTNDVLVIKNEISKHITYKKR